jgi:hypothetical protein
MTSNPSLSDRSHYDPCRKCGALFYRADMVPAVKYRPDWKRGHVCHQCHERRQKIFGKS